MDGGGEDYNEDEVYSDESEEEEEEGEGGGVREGRVDEVWIRTHLKVFGKDDEMTLMKCKQTNEFLNKQLVSLEIFSSSSSHHHYQN